MNQNIDLRHLRYFLAVAEELHFGHAARRLHIAQPPLSQQIRRLEQEIGYPLFLRTSRSVKLTPAGKALMDRAHRTLQKVDDDLEAVRSVARGEVGVLKVGFVGSAMLTRLPAILRKYRRMYASVQLHLNELHTSQLIDALREGSADVALARDAGAAEDLHVERVFVEPFVAVVPKKHPLAARRSIPVARLRGEPFVFFPRAAGSYAWENTIRLCEQQGFPSQYRAGGPAVAHHREIGRGWSRRDNRSGVGRKNHRAGCRLPKVVTRRRRDEHRSGLSFEGNQSAGQGVLRGCARDVLA